MRSSAMDDGVRSSGRSIGVEGEIHYNKEGKFEVVQAVEFGDARYAIWVRLALLILAALCICAGLAIIVASAYFYAASTPCFHFSCTAVIHARARTHIQKHVR